MKYYRLDGSITVMANSELDAINKARGMGVHPNDFRMKPIMLADDGFVERIRTVFGALGKCKDGDPLKTCLLLGSQNGLTRKDILTIVRKGEPPKAGSDPLKSEATKVEDPEVEEKKSEEPKGEGSSDEECYPDCLSMFDTTPPLIGDHFPEIGILIITQGGMFKEAVSGVNTPANAIVRMASASAVNNTRWFIEGHALGSVSDDEVSEIKALKLCAMYSESDGVLSLLSGKNVLKRIKGVTCLKDASKIVSALRISLGDTGLRILNV